MNKKNSFQFSFYFILSSFFAIVFQNLYTIHLRNAFDKKIIYRFLKDHPSKKNFQLTSRMFDELLKRENLILSNGVYITVSLFYFAFQKISSSVFLFISFLSVLSACLLKNDVNKNMRKAKIDEDDFISSLECANISFSSLKKCKKTVSHIYFLNLIPYAFPFILIVFLYIFSSIFSKTVHYGNFIFNIFFSFSFSISSQCFINSYVNYGKTCYYFSLLEDDISQYIIRDKKLYNKRYTE
ncbi:MAG: hypothetical protein MR497_05280 [Bacilli bacterium]|nr:hypothetical protein [Bacilli bacterium]